MTISILAQREIGNSEVLSATNEEGLIVEQLVPDTGNTGNLSNELKGPLTTTAVTPKIEIVTGGDLGAADYKYSIDAGSNYLGIEADGTWGNGAGGTELTARFADTAPCYISKPTPPVDTTGDGVPDTVFAAVLRTSTTPDQIDIIKTTDMSMKGAWTTVATDVTITTPQPYRPALAYDHIGKAFALFYQVDSTGTEHLSYKKSTDFCVTWVQKDADIFGDTLEYSHLDAIFVRQETNQYDMFFCVCKVNSDLGSGATDHITYAYVNTGNDNMIAGVQHADYIISDETDGLDKDNPTICRVDDGTGEGYTACFFEITSGGDPGIYMRDGISSLNLANSWSAPDQALWDADSNDSNPMACVWQDDTIYVVFQDAGISGIQYSKFTDGDANYSAAATVIDTANTETNAVVANIGGVLWCGYLDGSTFDIEAVVSRYLVTYAAGKEFPTRAAGRQYDYNSRWFGWQYLDNSLWILWGGEGGAAADTYTSPTSYDFGKERCIQWNPSRPTRATGDNAVWWLTFDMGANDALEVDRIAAMFNTETALFQMDDASSFDSDGGNPQVETTLSTVIETLSAAVWASDGTIYKSGGTMTVHEYKGYKVKGDTTGTVYEITDNDAERLYIRGTDVSALNGEDAKILSDRAWASQTAARHRYMRFGWDAAEAQQTSENYYEIPFLMFGKRLALTDPNTTKDVMTDQSVETYPLSSGRVLRNKMGGQRVDHALTLAKLATAQYDSLRAHFKYLDNATVPFVLIPDDSVTTDFRVVYVGEAIEWDAVFTTVFLPELI